jgi:succinate dehydrogenase / fumarate reductase cytochrome b subunit
MRIPDRTSDRLRRIHSLTGTIPLGVFLIEHVAVNSLALGGADRFRAAIETLGGIPMLAVIEIAGIALPLVVHSVIGVLIATELPEPARPTRREIVQRATGLLLLPYLIYHVWATRLSPDVLKHHADLFDVMHKQVSGAGGLAFHAIGVTLAAWHLGNGLPGFAERWGLARAPGAARAAVRLGHALSLVLAITGVAALIAFSTTASRGARAPRGDAVVSAAGASPAPLPRRAAP